MPCKSSFEGATIAAGLIMRDPPTFFNLNFPLVAFAGKETSFSFQVNRATRKKSDVDNRLQIANLIKFLHFYNKAFFLQLHCHEKYFEN